MSIKTAKTVLKNIGLSLQATGFGDYRVSNSNLDRARREATAYYTSDLEDAVITGSEMVKLGSW